MKRLKPANVPDPEASKKAHALFGKEAAELREAHERLTRRMARLLGPDGKPVHPPEEHARREAVIEEQFERVVRKLLARADRVEAEFERVLAASPDEAGAEAREKAEIRIKGARRLRRAVQEVRAILTNASTKQEER